MNIATYGEIAINGSDKKAQLWRDGNSMRLEFEPGNGSRYSVLVVLMNKGLRMGEVGMPMGEGAIVVCGPTPGPFHTGFFNLDGAMLVAEYVKEKMSWASYADASEATKVIGTVLGRPIRVFTRKSDGRMLSCGEDLASKWIVYDKYGEVLKEEL